MAAFPPDFHGKLIKAAADAALQGEAALVVFEGPRAVTWDGAAKTFVRAGWDVHVAEFISTEFGEATARRRVCLVAHPNKLIGNPMDTTTCRSLLAPPMAPHLEPTKMAPQSLWITPEKLVMDAGIPREPLLPLLKGHFWMDGVRKCLANTGGPLRWPLRVPGEARVEDCIVHDPRGPCGKLRRLTPLEVWRCQGRPSEVFHELLRQGRREDDILVDGGRATGGQVASALVVMAGFIVGNVEAETRAGGCGDRLSDEQLTKILSWLHRWRRGLLPRGHPSDHGRRAGGGEGHGDPLHFGHPRVVRRWLEAAWLADSSDSESEGDFQVEHRAGKVATRRGKGSRGAEEAVAVAQLDDLLMEALEHALKSGSSKTSPGTSRRAPRSSRRAWAKRHGWITEFLDKANLPEENEEKLLRFLGYLGWLGCSVATLKQAVFAIKDGHKRAGKGDPTERMFRLWMLLSALERRAPKKARRLGVTPEMLRWLAKFVHQAPDSHEDSFDAIMLNAALQTAWFFMLRAKEFCNSNGVDLEMILRGADLKFLEDESNGKVNGVTLQFRKTKVDQEAFGERKTLYVSGIPEVCVVTALLKFKAVAPQRFGNGCEALKPLFRWSSGQMLMRGQVQNVLQKAATACGLPAGRFMSHSLRIGGASALFQSTGEIELVKRNGRWSSSAVQRYLHDGEIALRNTAEKMAKVEQKIHYT